MKVVIYKKSARKALKSLPQDIALAFLNAFEALEQDPDRRDFDIRKLIGREGLRLRINKWRAIFIITDKDIQVLDISKRGDAY